MTPVQTQQRPADPAPVTPAVVDVTDVSGRHMSGLRVGDDMTVEVALSVMASARVGYLLLCDENEQCTGSITRAQLGVVRDSSLYTDRIRVRDVLGSGGPFAPPVATTAGAGHAKRYRRHTAPGVLALSR